MSDGDAGDPFNDPVYAANLRRWSRQVIPPWTRALIHSPRCDGTTGDPECSACKAFADWQREQDAIGEREARGDGH